MSLKLLSSPKAASPVPVPDPEPEPVTRLHLDLEVNLTTGQVTGTVR